MAWESGLLDVVESAIIVTDPTGIVTYWNSGAEAIYGWNRDEAQGRLARDLLLPDPRLSTLAWEQLRSGASWSGEVELQHRDGHRFWTWATVSPARSAAGETIGVVAVSRDITAERATAQHLRESEERFGQLTDHLPVVFWMSEVDSGAVIYISPAYETVWGRPVEELYADPKAYRNAIHPDDRQRIDAILEGRRAPGDLEYRIQRPDGSIRWIHDVSYPVPGPDGLPYRLAGIATDVTGLKASEHELARMNASLRESEGRFRELAEHIDAVFWLVEPDAGRLVYVSPSVERLFGISAAEMAENRELYWDRIHPDDRERVRGLLDHPTEEVEVEYRLVRPDGRTIWINDRSFPIRDERGRVVRLAGIGTDITARHETEAERALLTAAIEQTSDGMLLLDPSGTLLYANPAFAQITGYAVDELVGTRPRTLIDGIDMPGLGRAIESVATGEPWQGAMNGRRRDGTAYHAELAVWPLDRRESGPRNVLAVLRDVSELRQAEAALEREQNERAAIAASLATMRPGVTLGETAAQVVREIDRLPGINAGSVVAFDAGTGAWVLATDGPEGFPVQTGIALPAARSRFLRDRAVNPGPPDPFTANSVDGEMGASWDRRGVTAMAWVPIRSNEVPIGVIAVSTAQPDGVAVLERQLPALSEYAALASALLAPQLESERRAEAARTLIRDIIGRHAFHAVFQPIVELQSGTVVGHEALTRFDDGLAPDLHFQLAAAAGMGLELESATLNAAAGQGPRLPGRTWLSFNVSPELVQDGRILGDVMESCHRPIVLEVTEHTVVADYEALRNGVARLDRGARLAVDDAGAGFSSLRHIIELRPDIVKLDIGLVRSVDQDPARQSIVAGMVHFAATTGCVLLAEGVETEEERQELVRLGVTLGQGYLFGRPEPLAVDAPARVPMARGRVGSGIRR